MAASFKQKTVQMILQEFFKDEKTKINNEALELMTELITVFVEEAVSRTSRQAQKDGTTELSLEQFEKILPQLFENELKFYNLEARLPDEGYWIYDGSVQALEGKKWVKSWMQT